ncbi:hypothetical protein [Streptomyces erythrochromogenes]|uniref:hypothetical protein n=1 Tax=Streptomyces erythrochromogenes TaxID=285574 RepID=UPI0037D69A8E
MAATDPAVFTCEAAGVPARSGTAIALGRDAQRAGLLDPSRDPVDVLALNNQIATTWAGRPEIGAAAAQRAADTSTAARRAALVSAVERLFPRTS